MKKKRVSTLMSEASSEEKSAHKPCLYRHGLEREDAVKKQERGPLQNCAILRLDTFSAFFPLFDGLGTKFVSFFAHFPPFSHFF